MRVPSLERLTFLFVALLLAATPAAFAAAYPSARHNAGFVYDPTTTRSILFGGESSFDSGTRRSYDLGDTWEWTGLHWVQRYPDQSPEARSSPGMVWDSTHNRAILFGGRDYLTFLNDTWSYAVGQWTKIGTADAPSVRRLVGMSYDASRDRTVLFGGSTTSINISGVSTTNAYFDTWEFDGANWVRRQADGPHIVNTTLAYDAARNKTYMLGTDDKFVTKMYSWDPGAGAWNAVTASTIPPCTIGASIVYDPTLQHLFFTGGACPNSTVTNSDSYTWDGTTWTKLAPATTQGPLAGHNMVWDTVRNRSFIFGGVYDSQLVLSTTLVWDGSVWTTTGAISSPEPRSRFSFTSDPVNKTIWMYGGLNESQSFYDLWRYANGAWDPQDPTLTDYPSACYSPAATFDTDRNRLIFICQSSDVYEFDGTTWTLKAASSFKDSNRPVFRTFGAASYDPKLKKTVFFGGYDGTNYIDQTWLWDGTTWTRQKTNPPTARALMALFYDPVLAKTVVYGGIGRLNTLDRITRYEDVWTFDGSGWTQLAMTSAPGARYGMQLSTNPANGRPTIFGGLKLVPTGDLTQPIQQYMNDQWEWDGMTWVAADAANAPAPRENGGLAIDPVTGKLTLFAGYAGTYYSDVWVLDNGRWRVSTSTPVRRRIAGR